MHQIITKDLNELWGWLKNTIPQLNMAYEYLFVIKRYHKTRSTDQNSLYWMWVTAIANHTGHEKYEIHEAYIRMFLPWNEINLPGEMSYWSPGHTPDNDTFQFNEFLNKIHLHAHQFFDFHLPYPDEECFKEFAIKYLAISKAMDVKFVDKKKSVKKSKQL